MSPGRWFEPGMQYFKSRVTQLVEWAPSVGVWSQVRVLPRVFFQHLLMCCLKKTLNRVSLPKLTLQRWCQSWCTGGCGVQVSYDDVRTVFRSSPSTDPGHAGPASGGQQRVTRPQTLQNDTHDNNEGNVRDALR